MKTKTLLLAINFVLFALSCNKNKLENNGSNEKRASEVSIMQSASDISVEIQVYNLLSPGAKLLFWEKQLTSVQQKLRLSGSDPKADLVSELINMINEKVFIENSYEQRLFISYESKIWLDKAAGIFSAKEIYDYFFSKDGTKYGGEGSGTTGGGIGNTTCWCHVGNSGYSCKRTVVGFPSTTIEYGICEQMENRECEATKAGCGFLWLSSCNGNHCNFG